MRKIERRYSERWE